MSLNVTPDMLIELAEKTSDAYETRIVLTAEGWEVVVDTEGAYPAGLTAMTRADLEDLAEGDELDTETAERLITEGDYNIRTETDVPADDDGDWRVVTGEIDPDDPEPAYAWAWAFDLSQAREVIAEQPWRYYDKRGQAQTRQRVTSLYRTEDGTWVTLTRSRWVKEPDTWTEMTPAEAAKYAYRADPELIADNPPTLIEAAVKAAELSALITAPAIPEDWDQHIARGNAWQRREAAAETIHDGAVIADLIHEQVVADIKRQRSQAARVAVLAYGTQTAAAEELGMLQPRLNKLLHYDA